MAIRSQDDIEQSFLQYLQARFPLIDATTGRALASLLFDAIAGELATAYTALNQVQIEQGVSQPTVSSTDGLDDLAYNWNVTRKGAVAATGIITFQRATQPTTTIQIGTDDGAGNVVVATSRQQTGTVVSFITTETVFLTPETSPNPQTGLYEVDATISCVALGAIGNVDAGLITILQSVVPGIDFIINKISSTGGREEEDQTTLASRIVAQVQGLQPGIAKGLISTALAQNNVIDAVVVDPNNPDFTRAGVGGAVDVVVLGEQITSSQLQELFVTAQSSVLLTNRPATDITQVVATVGLTQTTLVPGVDYRFDQDTVSGNALSADSNDHLSWLSGQLPNNNTQVTISYQYDKVINAIQAIIDEDSKHYITANVLVKRATKVLIDISFTVRQQTGFASTLVLNNVAAAVSTFVNNLGLGDPVQQSDLVLAINSATGVDSVVLPFSKLCIRGSSGVADIQPTNYQYARVDSVSLNITVVSS